MENTSEITYQKNPFSRLWVTRLLAFCSINAIISDYKYNLFDIQSTLRTPPETWQWLVLVNVSIMIFAVCLSVFGLGNTNSLLRTMQSETDDVTYSHTKHRNHLSQCAAHSPQHNPDRLDDNNSSVCIINMLVIRITMLVWLWACKLVSVWASHLCLLPEMASLCLSNQWRLTTGSPSGGRARR